MSKLYFDGRFSFFRKRSCWRLQAAHRQLHTTESSPAEPQLRQNDFNMSLSSCGLSHRSTECRMIWIGWLINVLKKRIKRKRKRERGKQPAFNKLFFFSWTFVFSQGFCISIWINCAVTSACFYLCFISSLLLVNVWFQRSRLGTKFLNTGYADRFDPPPW